MRAILITTLLISLTLCQAGPTPKISEKRSLTEESRAKNVEGKEKLAIEDNGSEKDRSKKSTTTFCVEIRPGTQQAVQTPCICGETQPHVHPEPPRELPKPEPKPESSSESHSASIVKPEEPEPIQPPTQVIVQPLPEHQETFMVPACEEAPMYVMPPNQVFLVPEQELGPPSASVVHVPQPPLVHCPPASSGALIHVPSAPLIHVPRPAPRPPATLVHVQSGPSNSHLPFCPQYSRPPSAYTECTCRPKGMPMMRSDGAWMERSMDSGSMQDPMVGTHHHHHHQHNTMTPVVPMMVYKSPMMSTCGMNRPYVLASRDADGKMRMSDGRTVISVNPHSSHHPIGYHDPGKYDPYYRPHYGHMPNHHGYGSTASAGVYIESHPRMYTTDGRSMFQGHEMRMSPDGQMDMERTEMKNQGEESDMSRQLVPREAVSSDSPKDNLKDNLKHEVPVEDAGNSVRNARSEGSSAKNIEKEKNSIKEEKKNSL